MSPVDVLSAVLDQLWHDYRQRVPYADTYARLVVQKGGRVANDHLAFRTFNAAVGAQPAGVEGIRRVFLPLGYEQAQTYDFPQMNLKAAHLEHPDEDMPRIFISQLEVEALPAETQELIRTAVAPAVEDWQVNEEMVGRLAAIGQSEAQDAALVEGLVDFFRRPWPPPRRAAVLKVNEFSQYGAWTLLHGNSVNHFTAYINQQAVTEWPDIEVTIAALRDAGVPMKDNIEGERGSRLRQSSTRAAEGEFEVVEDDGTLGLLPWTYAYYELAERGMVAGPGGEMKLFTGFLGPQTPGLFEMTRRG